MHPELVFSGVDHDGEIRIIEIKNHDFFVSTLFVLQSRSTKEEPHPLIKGFLEMAYRQSVKD